MKTASCLIDFSKQYICVDKRENRSEFNEEQPRASFLQDSEFNEEERKSHSFNDFKHSEFFYEFPTQFYVIEFARGVVRCVLKFVLNGEVFISEGLNPH